MSRFHTLLSFLRTLFTPRLELAAENLALRQQLVILNRTAKQPKLQPQDRLFWNLLYRLWKDWRSALLIVKPEMVVKTQLQSSYPALFDTFTTFEAVPAERLAPAEAERIH